MSLRLSLGTLGWLSDLYNTSEGVDAPEKAQGEFDVGHDLQTPAKFHIGMLTISLIVGLGYGGFIAYTCWVEKDILLGYIRNLVIALVCRTFFSILFDGVILLGSSLTVGGGNTLLSFEQIFMNLVLAFWLSLTVYLHARVQRNFKSEPTLRLYQFGIPGIALFFSFIWIFVLQDQLPSVLWWLILNPFTQWIVNSLNLLSVLIQLGLVIDMGRIIMTKTSLDHDSSSLLWKSAAAKGILVFIFWLHFGMSLGRQPLRNSEGYLYFYYLIDGLECTLVCACLYFYNKWVRTLIKRILSIILGPEETPVRTTESNTEVLMPRNGDRGIFTIDRVFITGERERWKYSTEDENSKDVVYSNVVEPDRLKKTLELYKRLNIIPRQEVTVIEGEEFYDCQISASTENHKFSQQKQNLISNQKVSIDDEIKFKNDKISEQTQKKNAFYSSKYLILDGKKADFPKYLETRPSVSSPSEKDSPKEERGFDFPSDSNTLETDEMVRKWLNDYSEDMQINDEPKQRASIGQFREEPGTKNSEMNMAKDNVESETIVDTAAADRCPSEHGFVVKERIAIPDAVEVTTLGESKKRSDSQIDEQVETVEQKAQATEKVGNIVEVKGMEEAGSTAKQMWSILDRIIDRISPPKNEEITEKEIHEPQVKKKGEEFERTKIGLGRPLNNSNWESDKKQYKVQSEDLAVSPVEGNDVKDTPTKFPSQSISDQKQYKVQSEDLAVSPVEGNDVKDTPTKFPSQLLTYSELQDFRSKRDQPVNDTVFLTDKNSERIQMELKQFERTKIRSGEPLNNSSSESDKKQYKVQSEGLPGSPMEGNNVEDTPTKFPRHLLTYPELQDFRSKRDQFINDRHPVTKSIFRFSESILGRINSLINQDVPRVKECFLPAERKTTTEDTAEIKEDVRICDRHPRQPINDSKTEPLENLKEEFPVEEQTAHSVTGSISVEHSERIQMELKQFERTKISSGQPLNNSNSESDKKQDKVQSEDLPVSPVEGNDVKDIETKFPSQSINDQKQYKVQSEDLPKTPVEANDLKDMETKFPSQSINDQKQYKVQSEDLPKTPVEANDLKDMETKFPSQSVTDQKQYKVQSDDLPVSPVEGNDVKDTPTKFPSQLLTYFELQDFRSKRDQSVNDTVSLSDEHSERIQMESKTHSLPEKSITDQIPVHQGLERQSGNFESQMHDAKKWPRSPKYKAQSNRNKKEAQNDRSGSRMEKAKSSEHALKDSLEDSIRKFEDSIDKSKKSQPDEVFHVRPIKEPRLEEPYVTPYSAATSILKEKQMDLHEREVWSSDSEFSKERKKSFSSDSEFSIERRKSSSSDSFSVELYYSQMLAKRTKLNTCRAG